MRLGDLDALKKKIEGVVENEMPIDKKWALGLRYALKLIDNAPTVDVSGNEYFPYRTAYFNGVADGRATARPQGTWIFHTSNWSCSICNKIVLDTHNFCPFCGAEMRGSKYEID